MPLASGHSRSASFHHFTGFDPCSTRTAKLRIILINDLCCGGRLLSARSRLAPASLTCRWPATPAERVQRPTLPVPHLWSPAQRFEQGWLRRRGGLVVPLTTDGSQPGR